MGVRKAALVYMHVKKKGLSQIESNELQQYIISNLHKDTNRMSGIADSLNIIEGNWEMILPPMTARNETLCRIYLLIFDFSPIILSSFPLGCLSKCHFTCVIVLRVPDGLKMVWSEIYLNDAATNMCIGY